MRNSTIRVATFAGPGAAPVIRSVEWPHIPKEAALIAIGACGVCGTDLHILKGHWPKPLPWPFTLGHELGGISRITTADGPAARMSYSVISFCALVAAGTGVRNGPRA